MSNVKDANVRNSRTMGTGVNYLTLFLLPGGMGWVISAHGLTAWDGRRRSSSHASTRKNAAIASMLSRFGLMSEYGLQIRLIVLALTEPCKPFSSSTGVKPTANPLE